MAGLIRNASAADFEVIVALNQASVSFLSPLNINRLALLSSQSCYHRVYSTAQGITGFLLAFEQDSDYDSVNYQWFKQRYPQFVYIDRIVVSPSVRGQGVGRLLYEDLFDFARQASAPLVTCEYDLDPPNPASQAFHQQMGFKQVGSQHLDYAAKQVSMQAKIL